MARKKGSRDYPLEMRQEAVRLFYEEGMTQAEITKQLGIRDPKRVKNWMRRYRQEGAEFFVSRRYKSGRKPKKETEKAYVSRLEMENELLKKFHTELRKGLLAKRNIGLSKVSERNTQ